MEKWVEFEKECVNFLNSQYGDKSTFKRVGGSDSTAPDINVYDKKNKLKFSIEAKMSSAQSGQFVLFPKDGKFEYSTGNAQYPPNEPTKEIIKYMDGNFETYCKPGTKGVELTIPPSCLYKWVKEYYKTVKKEKYFITKKNDDFVIFPVDKIEEYLTISAKYREKKSGSSAPSNKNRDDIEYAVKSANISYSNLNIGASSTITLNNCDECTTLQGKSYRYQFKRVSGNVFQIRRLSNTSNANVIFSIGINKSQDANDLRKFEDALSK